MGKSIPEVEAAAAAKQLNEPLIGQSTLLNFYSRRGSRTKGAKWNPKNVFELLLHESGEEGTVTTSINFSFQPTNGKIMLQIAIRLFSSRQFHRIIFHFQIFTVVESGHKRNDHRWNNV